MPKKEAGRNPLFAKRWFQDDVIVTCVRWYLRFKLSYRDLASMAAELGIAVAPSTIFRWVIRYAEEFALKRPMKDVLTAYAERSLAVIIPQ